MCLKFTPKELADTKQRLEKKVLEFFSKPAKPDILLGSHPIVHLASVKQSISIWHGKRIEKNLSDWVAKIPGWSSKCGAVINIRGKKREIDNFVSNANLGIVLAIETKRIFRNQDNDAVTNIRNTYELYENNKSHIIAYAGIPAADFRFFVFDVYGETQFGSGGMPAIICGDRISDIFGKCLWKYMEWERNIIATEVCKNIDTVIKVTPEIGRDIDLDDNGLDQGECGYILGNEIISYIDMHQRK
jgi:hypothetical protein